MTVVADPSVVVVALVDDGNDGRWARAGLLDQQLTAPVRLVVEVSAVLRRAVLSQRISPEVGALAHRDLVRSPLTTFPFEPLAARVWQLHPSVTSHDAAFVALAEALDAPLWTLDRRLTRASGPRCVFRAPPTAGQAH